MGRKRRTGQPATDVYAPDSDRTSLSVKAVTFRLRWFVIPPVTALPAMLLLGALTHLLLSIFTVVAVLTLAGAAGLVVFKLFDHRRYRYIGWGAIGGCLVWLAVCVVVPYGPINPWMLLAVFVPWVFAWVMWCLHFHGINRRSIAAANEKREFLTATEMGGARRPEIVWQERNDYFAQWIVRARGQTFRSLDPHSVQSWLGLDHGALSIERAPSKHPDTGMRLGSDFMLVRAVFKDPHAEPILYPVHRLPTTCNVRSIPLGLAVDGEEDVLPIMTAVGDPLRYLVGGESGGGKSGLYDVVCTFVSGTDDATQLLYDMKGGQWGAHWRATAGRYVRDRDKARQDFDALGRLVEARSRRAADNGWEHWPGSKRDPWVFVLVDESWKLVEGWYDKEGLVALATQGRSVGVFLFLATQQHEVDATGGSRVKNMCPVRLAYRGNNNLADQILHSRNESIDTASIPLDRPGTMYKQVSPTDMPRRIRQYFVNAQMRAARNRERANQQAWFSPEDIAALGAGWERPYSATVVLDGQVVGSTPATATTSSPAAQGAPADTKEATVPTAPPFPDNIKAGPSPFGDLPPIDPTVPMPRAAVPPAPRQLSMSKADAQDWLVAKVESDPTKIWQTAELLRPLEEEAGCSTSWSYERLSHCVDDKRIKRLKNNKYQAVAVPATVPA
jgi:hypothetical protein